MRFAHDGVTRHAELAAQVEQIVLHARAGRRARLPAGPRRAAAPIALFSSSTAPMRLDARRVLRDARAVGEPGGAVVAGARVDFRQAVCPLDPCICHTLDKGSARRRLVASPARRLSGQLRGSKSGIVDPLDRSRRAPRPRCGRSCCAPIIS